MAALMSGCGWRRQASIKLATATRLGFLPKSLASLRNLLGGRNSCSALRGLSSSADSTFSTLTRRPVPETAGTRSVRLAVLYSATIARARRSPGSIRSKIAACDNMAASLVAPKARGNGIGLVTVLYGIVAPYEFTSTNLPTRPRLLWVKSSGRRSIIDKEAGHRPSGNKDLTRWEKSRRSRSVKNPTARARACVGRCSLGPKLDGRV